VTTPEKAVGTGEQAAGSQSVFTLTAAGVYTTCTEGAAEGTVQGTGEKQITATEGTLTARFTGCKLLGASATIDMNGCKYTLTQAKNEKGEPLEKTANIDLTGCTEAKKYILVTASFGCIVKVPEQNGLSHVTFTNEGSGQTEHVLDHSTVQRITYEFSGVFCPEKPGVLHHDADYEGTTTIKAFKDFGSVEKEHNGHKYLQILGGEQVGIFAT
jgi:hypothetical protein